MNLSAIATAIVTRALTDTGAGGLFNTSTGALYWSAAPTGQAKQKFYYQDDVPPTLPLEDRSSAGWPYVTFEVGGEAEEEDDFNGDAERVMFEFHIFDHKRNGSGISRVAGIIDRLFGDATTLATRVPGYGFHRHPLVLASGTWNATSCLRAGAGSGHEVDVWHFIEPYFVHQARVAPGA